MPLGNLLNYFMILMIFMPQINNSSWILDLLFTYVFLIILFTLHLNWKTLTLQKKMLKKNLVFSLNDKIIFFIWLKLF